jgi:hypothetical protein
MDVQINGLTAMSIEAWNEVELTRAQARLMFPRKRIQVQSQTQPINCPVGAATVVVWNHAGTAFWS